MWRLAAIAVAVLGLTANAAEALQLKNVRCLHGGFGSVRAGTKFMDKDIILLFYDIEGLKISDVGDIRFHVILEAFDKKQETPIQQQIALGGPTVAGSIHIMLSDQKPGKYSAKVTVLDKNSKESASFTYNFEIVPTALGFVRTELPAYGFINNVFSGQVVVVGMGRDAKMQPNVDIKVRVYDDQGKVTFAKPFSTNIPKDLPEELVGKDFAVFQLPLYLTRTGLFRVEIEAVDNVSKKTTKLSFPLKVVDPSAVK